MIPDLKVYNSLTRKKEVFKPINSGHVGMYVCGPTVYNHVHLGNLRTFISFDVIYRYLKFSGYKVRYVRNITDVGHLLDDSDEGEDKIGKRAKFENLEPMEIVQKYTNGFHQVMSEFNTLPPSIEPTATGHILEQIQMIEQIIKNGYAYESNGSVYFNIRKYQEEKANYGILSGRNIDELISNTRELDGQMEKKDPLDFAIWKNANKEHIMQWSSPWGQGFPGWHLECTVMSTKYLGERFDIHGGGMDLKFPHHECEIAQSVGACNCEPANYWLHTNMLTINGQKMSKSSGNSLLPRDLITGEHDLLDRGYSPMTIRFFMLQSHYANPLDISNEALNAAQKGYFKLVNGLRTLSKIKYQPDEGVEVNTKLDNQINGICDNCYRSMNDDFNTAQTISHLFNLIKKVNSFFTGQIRSSQIKPDTFKRMASTLITFTSDVLGLKEEVLIKAEPLVQTILSQYKKAKESKDYDTVDQLRSELKNSGISVKDLKTGVDWDFEEN